MASYLKRVAKIDKKLKLVEVSNLNLNKGEVKEFTESVNHVICIDISGSMYDVLPKIRTQLKSRLVDIVKENDSITMIWFENKSGYVCKEVNLNNVNDVRDMNNKIDSLLIPRGCTNFLDPLKLTESLVNSSKSKLWNFFFMSDGGHNSGGDWSSVINELNNIKGNICNATICEYGYWADTDKLNEMAEVLGGVKIFDSDFESYKVDFESHIKSGSKSSKRVELDVSEFKSDMKYKSFFSIDEETNDIAIYSASRVKSIYVPESINKLYYLGDEKLHSGDESSMDLDNNILYRLIYALSGRMEYDLSEELLYSVKDKELIDSYCNAYGKQKIDEFRKLVFSRVTESTKCTEFINQGYKSNPKKYCVLDLIDDLSHDDSYVHLTHPEFNYNLTTAKSVRSVELTESEKAALMSSKTKLKADKILESAGERLPDMKYSDEMSGYSIQNLVWNSERANLSIMVNIPVDLSGTHNGVKYDIKSVIIRNYTIIKDGILNTPELIITSSTNNISKFKRMGLVVKEYEKGMVKINISSLPIINKYRTKSVESSKLVSAELNLLEARAYNKYISYLLLNKKKSEFSHEDLKVSELDKVLGIKNGIYTPKTELSKSGDSYKALTLLTKIEKFSSLPKIEDVLKKRSSGKEMSVSEKFMDKIMTRVDSNIENLLEMQSVFKKTQKHELERISKMKMTIIMSRGWFSDKSGFDDNSSEVLIDGNKLKMSFVFSEKNIDL